MTASPVTIEQELARIIDPEAFAEAEPPEFTDRWHAHVDAQQAAREKAARIIARLPALSGEPVAWRYRYVREGANTNWTVRQRPIEAQPATEFYCAVEVQPLYLSPLSPDRGEDKGSEPVVAVVSERTQGPCPAPSGWRLVPVEPTPEMLQGGCRKHTPGQPMDANAKPGWPGEDECPTFGKRRRIWADMLANAPSLPAGREHDERSTDGSQAVRDEPKDPRDEEIARLRAALEQIKERARVPRYQAVQPTPEQRERAGEIGSHGDATLLWVNDADFYLPATVHAIAVAALTPSNQQARHD